MTGSPWRRVRLDRVEALFEVCRALDGVMAPEARALAAAVVEALRRDRERFSDVLEPSISIDEAGEHALRFSYAFPGFREAPASAAQAALAMAAPFGPTLTAATRRLLRAATDPAVEQPLVGIAWDRADAPRHKLYLQLRDGAGGAAADLAGRLLGLPWLAESLAREAPLHMLGLDLGQDGLTGAKLYLAHAVVPPDDGPIAQTLAGLTPEPRPYRRVLEIRRLTAASHQARELPPASDVDLGLADNDLTWEDVAKVPTLAPIVGGSVAIRAVFSSFQVGVRRLSLSLSSGRRRTVYYALREVEA